MFTNRFIKIPVDLYERKDAEMIGYNKNTKSEGTIMFVQPFEISHFRPTNNDDTDELTCVLIHMKNGDSFVSSLNIKEFEKILNKVT